MYVNRVEYPITKYLAGLPLIYIQTDLWHNQHYFDSITDKNLIY